eukprot:TRINITY_DN6350_c2_g1_i1.p1 TRINITY_DN6350_c2_g1~~TRINITY_DN6350_c2_g1_i1.p1  ORF type:complete len:538 (-),score=83.79 TRINITY_DN6350_c2_g1_i1:57-1577(-)
MAAEEDDDEEEEVEEEESAPLPTIEYPENVAAIMRLIMKACSKVDGAAVYAFGSAVNGFGDAVSDVDLVLAASKASLVKGFELQGKVTKRAMPSRVLACLEKRLKDLGFKIREKVFAARVPVLKMTLKSAGDALDAECDLSVNNVMPVWNTRLLKSYADFDPRATALVAECKRWARAEGVHGASVGHLSSYSFTLLVIFYMQVRGALPCLQEGATVSPVWYREGSKRYNVAIDDPHEALTRWKKHASGDLVHVDFVDFARFYAEEFEWGKWVVSVRTGKCSCLHVYPELRTKRRDGVPISELDNYIHIEDPIDIERNLNIVLGPKNNMKLWFKFVDVAKHGVSEWTDPCAPRADLQARSGGASVTSRTGHGDLQRVNSWEHHWQNGVEYSEGWNGKQNGVEYSEGWNGKRWGAATSNGGNNTGAGRTAESNWHNSRAGEASRGIAVGNVSVNNKGWPQPRDSNNAPRSPTWVGGYDNENGTSRILAGSQHPHAGGNRWNRTKRRVW